MVLTCARVRAQRLHFHTTCSILEMGLSKRPALERLVPARPLANVPCYEGARMSKPPDVLVDAQESLESVIKGEVIRMYQEVADHPEAEFHFYHGREAAEMFGYDPAWLERAPAGAVASFAGVGNPHERSALAPGETVLDLGSGAGLDSLIASWQVGPTGRVFGVDLNPAMCARTQAHAAITGVHIECHEGRMEDIPLPAASVDVVLSNGVINLSFQKRRVVQELFRVLRPGGRLSIADIVSAKQLSQSIVNDPKLWAS
jgi:2-polyprenyl-3-methyl-5-hydroxy-6-metoxy-1,4-benzoquinol methylase